MAVLASMTACELVSGLAGYTDVAATDADAPLSPTSSDGAGASVRPVVDAGDEVSATVGNDGASGEIGRLADDEGDGESSDDSSDGGPGSADDAANVTVGDAGVQDASVVDATTGSSANDAGTEGHPGDSGCRRYTHSNGVGQSFVDCVPVDTFDQGEAFKACAAADAGECALNPLVCGPAASPVVCTPTISPNGPFSTCACWSYSGPNAGNVGTTFGLLCGGLAECPVPGGTKWH